MAGPRAPEFVRFLFAFHAWARPRVVAAAFAAGEERVRGARSIPGGLGDGSVFDGLAHIVAGETMWLHRWKGESPDRLLAGSDFEDLAAIAAAWERIEAERGEWLVSAGEDRLGSDLHYRKTDGTEQSEPLWQTVMHVSNHTTHHRADVCTALTAAGFPPPSVDLIEFVRSEAGGLID